MVQRVTAGITYDRESYPGDAASLAAALVKALGIENAEDLTLTPVDFAEIEAPPAEEEPGMLSLGNVFAVAKYAAAGLAGLGLLLFFRGAFRGRPSRDLPALSGANLDLTVGDQEDEERVNPKVIQRQRLKKEIARAIDQDPRGVARLVEMWLQEESV
jgi:flagellar biosynthesis/type III secretory pathway M-ring protein FliF/YscJ